MSRKQVPNNHRRRKSIITLPNNPPLNLDPCPRSPPSYRNHGVSHPRPTGRPHAQLPGVQEPIWPEIPPPAQHGRLHPQAADPPRHDLGRLRWCCPLCRHLLRLGHPPRPGRHPEEGPLPRQLLRPQHPRFGQPLLSARACTWRESPSGRLVFASAAAAAAASKQHGCGNRTLERARQRAIFGSSKAWQDALCTKPHNRHLPPSLRSWRQALAASPTWVGVPGAYKIHAPSDPLPPIALC